MMENAGSEQNDPSERSERACRWYVTSGGRFAIDKESRVPKPANALAFKQATHKVLRVQLLGDLVGKNRGVKLNIPSAVRISKCKVSLLSAHFE